MSHLTPPFLDTESPDNACSRVTVPTLGDTLTHTLSVPPGMEHSLAWHPKP